MEGVSIELILALKPDVILLSHSSRISQRLKELGVPVLELDTTSLEGTHHLLNTVGTLVAKPEVANQVWAGILAQINEANQKIPRSLKGKTVYWEVSSAPFAAGESSFIGELLMGFGLKNIVDRRLGPFPKLNPEYIVRADPDILMGAQSDFANLSDRPGFNSLHALMQHNLCAFTPNEISLINRPGPRVGESALVIADCLNQLDSHFNKQVNRGH
jgi:iron complex transport system substrate-binding protein